MNKITDNFSWSHKVNNIIKISKLCFYYFGMTSKAHTSPAGSFTEGSKVLTLSLFLSPLPIPFLFHKNKLPPSSNVCSRQPKVLISLGQIPTAVLPLRLHQVLRGWLYLQYGSPAQQRHGWRCRTPSAELPTSIAHPGDAVPRDVAPRSPILRILPADSSIRSRRLLPYLPHGWGTWGGMIVRAG
jgi:hypothetical protein